MLLACVVALTALGVSAASAFAAPSNDDFADRQVIGPNLPIELSVSNVGASKEVGEPRPSNSLGAAGRTIWFEWTPDTTEVVTLGACGASIHEDIAVYTGDSVGALTEIGSQFEVGDFRNCGSTLLQKLTFEAFAGTTYVIQLDGDRFAIEPPPAPGEGQLALQIEATPPAPNDDFADARVLLPGEPEEEPGGRRSTFIQGEGYNWGATKEPGEPDHDGKLGGASVWFSWTAPASGNATVGACCLFGAPTLIGIYTGDSVDALTPVPRELTPSFPFPRETYPVVAGVEYRIAVDGGEIAQTHATARGAFQVFVDMELPRLPGAGNPPPPSVPAPPRDATPPLTSIARKPALGPGVRIFTFSSSELGGSFLCRLDRQRLAPCLATVRYRHLPVGRHRLAAIAVDAVGNADPTPATVSFTIPPHRSRGKA